MNQQIEIQKRKKTDFCSNLFTVFDSKMMTFIGRYWGSTEVRGIETKISFWNLQFYLTPLIVTDRQIDRQTEAQTNKNRQIDW